MHVHMQAADRDGDVNCSKSGSLYLVFYGMSFPRARAQLRLPWQSSHNGIAVVIGKVCSNEKDVRKFCN